MRRITSVKFTRACDVDNSGRTSARESGVQIDSRRAPAVNVLYGDGAPPPGSIASTLKWLSRVYMTVHRPFLRFVRRRGSRPVALASLRFSASRCFFRSRGLVGSCESLNRRGSAFVVSLREHPGHSVFPTSHHHLTSASR